MTASNSSRSHGVTTEDFDWGCTFSRGTRDALTAGGVTNASPFPGDPGEKKTRCKTTDPHGRAITILRSSKTTFSVYRDWDEDEKAALEARRAKEKEVESAFAVVGSWPKTSEAFRESATDTADFWLGMLEGALFDGTSGGWRYNDATTHKIERLVDEMMALIKTGAIVMDQALRDKYTPACVFEAVKAAEENALAQYGGNVVRFRPALTR